MTIWETVGWHQYLGRIVFRFKNEPSVADILKRWEEWVQGAEKRLPAYELMKESLLKPGNSSQVIVTEN